MVGFPCAFVWVNNIHVYIYIYIYAHISWLLYSSIDGHLGGFCVLAIVNDTTVNMVMQIYF